MQLETFRQEIRTPDTPHLARLEFGQATRSLALYVLVDRSGSMDRFEQAVREALMTIYLAAVQVGIPIGMAYFGEDDFYAGDSPLPPDLITVEQTVAEVAPLSPNNNELAKSLIAGYTGWSYEEYLDWGLRKAEAELRTRPERLHVLLIIHDGEPVFRTRTTSDWDLSQAHLRSLERAGVIPIGVHLGDVMEKSDGTVYGDGVNIAARLQALASPGGITVSDAVKMALRGRVNAIFEDQGEQAVKNIPDPVRAYAIRLEGQSRVAAPTRTGSGDIGGFPPIAAEDGEKDARLPVASAHGAPGGRTGRPVRGSRAPTRKPAP